MRNAGDDLMTGLAHGMPGAVQAVSRIITGFLVRARVHDLGDAWDDVRQDVLLALVVSVRQGRPRAADAFVGYVGAVTRHKLVDWLDRHRGRRAGEPLPEVGTPARDDDMRLDLERALDGLDTRARAVIEAIYLAGYSYEEAAVRLGLPLGTLKRTQTGALHALRRQLCVTSRRVRPARAGDRQHGSPAALSA